MTESFVYGERMRIVLVEVRLYLVFWRYTLVREVV